ncbi:MAG: IS66 family transposase [Lamprobacter sp.]|uniref:IS66 family transposase n=1 Tax=Lamprobacter sp. TaxID=3100796 RepID=UPI002B256953|nr:IS66 family transposase [Lamprobacter sp.]MEA3640317.1 IS66 family transposase [Lamprobacter sp.]
MQTVAHTLPDEPSQLHGIIHQLVEQLAQSEQQRAEQTERLEQQATTLAQHRTYIDQLLETIELLRRKRFGPSTDQIPDSQLALFDETELEALIGELEEALARETPPETHDTDEPPKTKAKRKPVRRRLPSHLPRVERLLDLPEAIKAAMGEDWRFIGYDSAEQLAVIPRQYDVIEYKRAKYVPINDAVPGAEVGVKIAPRPASIIPKSLAHSSLIAQIVTHQFVDALPLYRQEQLFAREGIELSRQTMAGLLIGLNDPLQPVAAALKGLLTQGPVVHIDETPLQVLDEPGRDPTQPSYMWAFCGGPPGIAIRWFEYAPSRGAEVPRRVLFPSDADPASPFYLQSDGYSAYQVLATAPEIIDHAGCWAHVRRKFVEAASGRNTSAAQQMVALIGELYAVERRVRESDAATRQRERNAHSRPILMRIRRWLDKAAARAAPKSLLGQAIHYSLGQWPILITFLEDGHLEVDNNRAENAIRPFVVGRKNWLFAGSPKGAETSALLYSLVETAKANGLEPWAYLNHLFEHLPAAKTPEAIAALLPHNLKMDDLNQQPSIR